MYNNYRDTCYLIYCKDEGEYFYKPVSILIRLCIAASNLDKIIGYMERCYQHFPRKRYRIVDYITGKIVYE